MQHGTQQSQKPSCSLFFQGHFWYDLGMCLQCSESVGKYNALTLEVGFSGKTWRSHIFESIQFVIHIGLITQSLLMPYLPGWHIIFPAFCVLRVTHCLKMLVGSHFSVAISPDIVTLGKTATLTGKGKGTSIGLLNHVFSIGAIHST